MANSAATQIKPKPRPKRRLLILEDDSNDRMRLRRTFSLLDKSLHLEFAHTLKTARHALVYQPFNGAVFDNILPDGKGIDLALEMARNSHLRHLPVFIITGWPSPFLGVKAESARIRNVYLKSDFGAREAGRVIAVISDCEASVPIRQAR